MKLAKVIFKTIAFLLAVNTAHSEDGPMAQSHHMQMPTQMSAQMSAMMGHMQKCLDSGKTMLECRTVMMKQHHPHINMENVGAPHSFKQE